MDYDAMMLDGDSAGPSVKISNVCAFSVTASASPVFIMLQKLSSSGILMVNTPG